MFFLCVSVRPRFHGQFFFDKVGLSQKKICSCKVQFCGEVSLSNICDKDERAKKYVIFAVCERKIHCQSFCDKLSSSKKKMSMENRLCQQTCNFRA